ncbi:hypothetical protein BLOT_003626 [Blomia tropicalis]|nr:hypothetical protein BLOT_003626 [Blomia tropicalis]
MGPRGTTIFKPGQWAKNDSTLCEWYKAPCPTAPHGARMVTIAVAPAAASPIPNPAMPCSHNGVLNTRSLPNLSCNPTVHRNTPPNATSSPNITADGSEASEISNALFTA